ncbi:MAG: glycosyltransferase family 4 protein [Acidimicrobiales bacterium]|nr:glycosyltransferase family 4 protein [Acidimicrobiales bacterium]
MSSPSEVPSEVWGRRTDRAVGYVVKSFPRLSETFILNEILAREAAGEHVEIASLRRPTDARFHGGLADLRAPIEWIPDDIRSAERFWRTFREGVVDLPGFPAAIDELLAADVDDAIQAIAVARWALERDVDHLHAHFATTAATVARLAGALAGLPYSFTAHAKDIFHESVDQERLARLLSDAHHVVTVSDYNVDHLTRRFPEATTRLHRVYNGISSEVVDVGVPTAAPVGPPSIVAVGRLVEKKGFEHLIDAAAILAERGVEVPVLLGGTGRCEQALRDRIELRGLEGRVQMLGALTQARTHDLIRRGTVFAAPFVVADDGDREGLPTVVLEAMALGTPVVTTAVTGTPEAITDGVTGLLVPEADPWALADAIVALLEDPSLRRRLSMAARERVRRQFDLSVQAETLGRLRRSVAPLRDDLATSRTATA